MVPSPRPTRRWFQFRLRSLLGAVTLLAVVAAMVGYRLNQPRLVEFDSKNDGDPNFVMTFKELKRDRNISTVRVDIRKGGSVGTSIMVGKLLCDVAKSRHMEYYIVLKEWREKDGARMMLVGLTNDNSADIKTEFGSSYNYLYNGEQKRGYTSAHELDELFPSPAAAPNKQAR